MIWHVRKTVSGFTLIELLLIMAIIGLLTAIAIPTYHDQVRKARRAKAIAALTEIATREESYFTQNLKYADSLNTLGVTDTVHSNNQVVYQLSLEPLEGGDYTQGYMAKAEPQGDQAKDRCGTLSIDSLGRKSDELNGQCWP